MDPQWKMGLAREWLTLVIGLFIGFLLSPLVLLVRVVLFGGVLPKTVGDLGRTYLVILHLMFASVSPISGFWEPVSFRQRSLVWVLMLTPYAIWRFVRSIT